MLEIMSLPLWILAETTTKVGTYSGTLNIRKKQEKVNSRYTDSPMMRILLDGTVVQRDFCRPFESGSNPSHRDFWEPVLDFDEKSAERQETASAGLEPDSRGRHVLINTTTPANACLQIAWINGLFTTLRRWGGEIILTSLLKSRKYYYPPGG